MISTVVFKTVSKISLHGQQLQGLQAHQNQAKRAGKTLRRVFHPFEQIRNIHPLADFDLVEIQAKRSIPFRAVNVDELVTGLLAWSELEKQLQIRGGLPAELFVELAHGCLIVVLAGIDMARTRGIPSPRPSVLVLRALLHEYFALVVEDQHVDGPMSQPFRMYFGARALADNFIVFVNYVENIFLHGFWLR